VTGIPPGEEERPSSQREGPTGSHRAYFPETGEVALPRFDRGALAPGAVVTGPAMVEDAWSTIVVYPGQRAAADTQGHLILDLEVPA
jgi:N-methylhydantoinase A